jgi:hypothetical protein
MKTAFVVISRGWDIRGILRTGVLEPMARAGIKPVILCHRAGDPEFRSEFGRFDLEVYEGHVPGRMEGTYRRAVNSLYSVRFPQHTLDKKAAYQASVENRERPLKRAFYSVLRGAGRVCPPLYGAARLIEPLFPLDRRWGRLFDKWKPDAVVTAPLFDWSDVPVLKWARRLGVPSVSIVAAWDNISSKGAIPIPPEALIVWNEDMKKEAVDTHDYPAERVAVTGAPQFDHWAAPARARADFMKKYGLPEESGLLGYNGASAKVLPSEHEVVHHLTEANEKGAFGEKMPVFLRLHPRERRPEMLAFRSRPGFIVEKPEHSQGNDWDANLDDLAHLADTVRAADVSMNVCSTITIESCIADRPVFNIGYDGDRTLPPEESAARYYAWSHYRRIPECGIPVALSRDAMIELARDYLKDPAKDRDARGRVVRALCGSVGGAAERMGRAIARFVTDGPAAIARDA